MWTKLTTLTGTALGKVLLGTTVAIAATGGAQVTGVLDDPAPIAATVDDAAELSTHAVLDAGTVTIAVDGLDVRVVSADATDGWTTEIETDEPHEAEVNFRNGSDRVDFRAEIDDGELRIRVRDRRTDEETETTGGQIGDSTASADDRDDDDDADHDDDHDADHDADHDDHDRSGRSHDDDHDDDDHDRSGSSHDDDRSGSSDDD